LLSVAGKSSIGCNGEEAGVTSSACCVTSDSALNNSTLEEGSIIYNALSVPWFSSAYSLKTLSPSTATRDASLSFVGEPVDICVGEIVGLNDATGLRVGGSVGMI